LTSTGVKALKCEIRALDSQIPLDKTMSMDAVIGHSINKWGFAA